MPIATARPVAQTGTGPLDLAVVVPSCDAYADLWPAFFSNLFRRWPDCPTPVYLISNEREFSDARVVSIRVGADRGWSDNLKLALESVPHEHVLLAIEDLFPTTQIDTAAIVSLAAEVGEFDYLRLNPIPGPRKAMSARVGLVPPGDIYRTSTVFSIWRRGVLASLLSVGESAWQFELNGSERSDRHERWFASRRFLIPYANLVVKGKIDPLALRVVNRIGIAVDSARETLRLPEVVTLLLKKVRSKVFTWIPWRMQRRIRGNF